MADDAPLMDPAVAAFILEFEQEAETQSDRAIAVLGLAGIDYFLELLLKSYMIGRSPELFTGTGPLATASARIGVARGLGLVSEDEFSDLQLLRRVRNTMAHQLSGARFDDDSVRDRCLALKLCDRLFTPRQIPFADLPDGSRGMTFDSEQMPVIAADDLQMRDAKSPRIRFVATVSILMKVLPARSRIESVSSPAEFLSPTEPVSWQMDRIDRLITEEDAVHADAEVLIAKLAEAQDPKAQEIREMVDSSRKRSATLRMVALMGRYSNAVIDHSRRIAGLEVPLSDSSSADG